MVGKMRFQFTNNASAQLINAQISNTHLLNLWSCTGSMAGDLPIVRRKVKAGTWAGSRDFLAFCDDCCVPIWPLGWSTVI